MTKKRELEEQRDALITKIAAARAARGYRRTTLQEFDAAPRLDDGIDCGDAVLVGFVTDLMLRGELGREDFPWEERHVRLLRHISHCESCLVLSLLDDDDPDVDAVAAPVIERMKTDPRTPEYLRDVLLRAFGAPKPRIRFD